MITLEGIGNLGYFPNSNPLKILWIELISDKIVELYKIILGKLHECEIYNKFEKADFNSHITIARVKKINNRKIFFENVNKINLKKIEFKAKSFSLMKSELTKFGSIYETVEKYKFGI